MNQKHFPSTGTMKSGSGDQYILSDLDAIGTR